LGGSPNPHSNAPARAWADSGSACPRVIVDRDRIGWSPLQLAFQPSDCDPRFVRGRDAGDQMIDAIASELGKDRGRSVGPVCRRRGLMRGLECMPVGLRSGSVRRRGRMTVASVRRLFACPCPANMAWAKSDPISGTELGFASRSFADFWRDIRVRFGSFHGSYPAFRLF